LFTGVDGTSPQLPHPLSTEWRKAADRIALGGVAFQALRHTHASHLIAAGIDVVKSPIGSDIRAKRSRSASMLTCSRNWRTKAPKRSTPQWRTWRRRDRNRRLVGKSMDKTRFVPPAATPSR
jgi:hypothetical protein